MRRSPAGLPSQSPEIQPICGRTEAELYLLADSARRKILLEIAGSPPTSHTACFGPSGAHPRDHVQAARPVLCGAAARHHRPASLPPDAPGAAQLVHGLQVRDATLPGPHIVALTFFWRPSGFAQLPFTIDFCDSRLGDGLLAGFALAVSNCVARLPCC